MITPTRFHTLVLDWYHMSGRKNLPWQRQQTPYHVWLSEIMLQQTQVATVIPYFEKFIQHFPTVIDLAQAELDPILSLWSGLGYYSRARNLHKAAQIIQEEYNGQFPASIEALVNLPGVGRSTAGAIVSLGFNQPAPILDGNVKRVFARFFAIAGYPGKAAIAKELWQLTEHYLPLKNARDYTQALMDLGATVCTRSQPSCAQCPLSKHCQAYLQDRIAELPGKKPKKRLPVKETLVLLLINPANEILLEKRPDKGIWANLWSLPECASDEELAHWLKAKALSLKQQSNWTVFRHTFSHYHLDIHPRLLTVEQQPLDAHWFAPAKALRLGLPAPIRRLIEEYANP